MSAARKTESLGSKSAAALTGLRNLPKVDPDEPR